MKPFQSISLWRCRFPFRLSFRHRLAARSEAETIIVRLRARTGQTGWGQALPRAYLTGESLEGVEDDIRRRWWPLLREADFPDDGGCPGILDALRPLYRTADAARALAAYSAIEAAALGALLRADGRGREDAENGDGHGKPEEETGNEVPLVGVVSAGSPRRAYWTAAALRLLGYNHFKVKVGLDRAGDHARLAAVRRAAGPSSWLAVDANGAWTWDTAVTRLRELAGAGVRLAEEPLLPGEAGDYGELSRLAGVDVMADESICSLEDAHKLLERGAPGWWNLRYGKNGGANGLLELAALGRANGIRLYGGVLVGETSALAAAGRFGMGLIRPECCEYGFPRVLLRGDPFRGGPGGFSGTVRLGPPHGAGPGVRAVSGGLERRGTMVWSDGGE